MAAPLLVAVPGGLSVNGVSMWAVRLAGAMVQRGSAAGLVLHREPPGCPRLDIAIDPRVQVFSGEGGAPLPRFDEVTGNLTSILPSYARAVRTLAAAGDGPVVFSPNLHGDCYGIAASLCLAEPELVRIVGWQHSDIEYDTRVLLHYESIITRFVAVSDTIAASLQTRLRGRARDLANIPYGVECSAVERPADSGPPPASALRPSGSPIRLLYAGRLEHEQKRILALTHLVDELHARSIAHELTIIGDGPAAAELDAHCLGRATVRRFPAAGPTRVAQLLASHDAFILPSRYEGLSIAVLEAMSHGCVPILARTRSGAAQAIEPGFNGELAEVAPEADERAAGIALAEAVARHIARTSQERSEMSIAARDTIRQRFSLDLHAVRVQQVIEEVAASPPRSWSAQLPCAFSASFALAPGAAAGSGSVPADGGARLAALLRTLAGRRIIIHGTGQHTLQLASVLARSPAHIVAFTDDDRQQYGTMLWNWPVLSPTAPELPRLNATDVVISSWMHQESIWSRRSLYESQGLRMHRIYTPDPDASPHEKP